MLKIHTMSDLHLEFEASAVLRGNGFVPHNRDNADVLILAGDIQVGTKLYAWFSDRLRDYKHVIYIAGNHEFYKQNLYKLLYANKMQEFVDEVHKDAKERGYEGTLHFLHNSSVTIDDVTFFGSTLWTNMNSGNPITLHHVQGAMNDFRLIKYVKNDRYEKFTTTKAMTEHNISVQYLTEALANSPTEKKVVVTHHSPTFATISPKYRNDTQTNYGYASELPDLIEQADLWIHGHIHHAFDDEVYGTRIVLNPRGYVNYEDAVGFDPYKFIEV